jgi:hypothetical protein
VWRLRILKKHVVTRKPNLIPGFPLRVVDVKPTGYAVSSRRREDTQKEAEGGEVEELSALLAEDPFRF